MREALRVYDRYAREVVERFDFCPWATRARREGAAEPHVLLDRDPNDFSASLSLIAALAARPRITVGLLIYPHFDMGRLDFEHFVRRLRQADAERHEPGCVPFAMAAFHPQADPALDDAERMVPFLRRSPDPTIQLVRCDALAAVRGTPSGGTALVEVWMLSAAGLAKEDAPDVRERIALNNLKTVREVGPAAIEAVLADIERDRATCYAELGLPPRVAVNGPTRS
ncbi:MAG TPA: DUF1415 family protein [Polyangiaceae bacterium]|nr:DUF1415 family protein [Polyangiaceae bacterium]